MTGITHFPSRFNVQEEEISIHHNIIKYSRNQNWDCNMHEHAQLYVLNCLDFNLQQEISQMEKHIQLQPLAGSRFFHLWQHLGCVTLYYKTILKINIYELNALWILSQLSLSSAVRRSKLWSYSYTEYVVLSPYDALLFTWVVKYVALNASSLDVSELEGTKLHARDPTPRWRRPHPTRDYPP